MFGVKCFDTHDEPISHYTQWDINQTLKIVLYGMDDGYMKNAPYVHFANIKSSEALVVPSTLQGDNTIIVDIPNILLQELWPLLVYVYLSDSTDASSQRTIVKIEIPVHKRARPSNYEYVENIDRITAEVIKQEIYDDIMDEVHGGNIAYPYVTFIDESTGKHVNLKVSDEKFGLYVDSTNRQLLDTGDIVNNLMTNSSTKALSASMGVTIKNMVDVIPDQIDEKIEEHDSSPTSHSDIRDDISSVSSAVDTMQDSIAEIENKIDDVMLDDTISGSGILTTTDTLVDSSPIEMRIKGATRQNLWVNPSGTNNGVTVTSNGDGSITVSGTSTASVPTYFNASHRIYALKPETTYTLSVDKAFTGMYASVREDDSSGSAITTHTVYSGAITFQTKANMTSCLFFVSVAAGTTVSGTYRVMLNEGSTAEPWCPPGLNSVDELSVVCAGKNLLARLGPELPNTYAGITFSDNGDGGIRVSGTATADAYYNFFGNGLAKALRITPGEYTASLIGGGSGLYLSVSYYDGEIGGSYTQWLVSNVPGISNTGSIDRPVYLRPFLSVAKGKTVDTVVYPQLELGSTATAYEPPNITTTPIDLQGHTLNALPDGTSDELTIDATGAVTLVQRVGVSVIDGSEPGIVYTAGPPSRIGASGLAPGVRSTDTTNSNRCDTLPCTKISSGPNAINTYSGGYVDIRCEQQITSLETGKAWLAANHTTLLYPLATPETIPLTAVTLPTLPSDKSNIYAASNVPTAGLTVRYWKKGGELVANLYKLLQNHEA